jgi:hypothetical protein
VKPEHNQKELMDYTPIVPTVAKRYARSINLSSAGTEWIKKGQTLLMMMMISVNLCD